MALLQQTPAHSGYNADLLLVMPPVERVVEVGCSTGALAKAYKQRCPASRYTGIEVDANYAHEARSWCDQVLVGDAEELLTRPDCQDDLRASLFVFGDSLEHLNDPWKVLRDIYHLLPPGGWVCACIPKAQHWSLQARLCIGALQYEDSGLMDRTHLRWFTRSTMIPLFEQAGFRIMAMQPRIFPHPRAQVVIDQIAAMAKVLGGDSQVAARDAMPLQYVIKARKDESCFATGGFTSSC